MMNDEVENKTPYLKMKKLAAQAAMELGLPEWRAEWVQNKDSTVIYYKKENGEEDSVEVLWASFKTEATVELFKVEIKKLIDAKTKT